MTDLFTNIACKGGKFKAQFKKSGALVQKFHCFEVLLYPQALSLT